MSKEPTTIASWCVPIVAALREAGVDPAPLFRDAGLDMDLITRPHARFPVSGMTRLWNAAAAAAQDPAFGITVSRHYQPNNLQAFGLALLVSTSLRDAGQRIARFSRLVSNFAGLDIREQGDLLQVRFHVLHPELEVSPHAMTAFLAVILNTARALTLGRVEPARVLVDYPEPADPQPWLRAFGPSLCFAAGAYGYDLDREFADQPLPSGNAELAQMHDEVLAGYLQQLDLDSVEDRVRKAIIERLPSGEPSLEEVATQLGTSSSRLQRELSAAGSSFRGLLDDTRGTLALRWVGSTDTPLMNIAFDLGFAEQASFTRAFRRWTGESPRSYREARMQHAG